MTRSLFIVLSLAIFSLVANAVTYDLVITGGRVIDPESGLDAVRNVGIRGDSIVMVSADQLAGREQLDARGRVVAPGFIDLHSHAQNIFGQTYQVRDGVTTALELEVGTQLLPLPEILAARAGKSLIHYGYSAGYRDIRFLVKVGTRFQTAILGYQRAFHEVATAEERQRILTLVAEELDQGAMGIGIPLDYVSRGVNDAELEALFRLAAEREMPVFVHMRMADDVTDTSGLRDLLAVTRRTRASLHVVHLVSMALGRTDEYIALIRQAQAEGLDVTTEVYPYTAASASINSGIFDHDWQKKWGISYSAIEWPPTGQRFTDAAMWNDYRARYPAGVIILHAMKEAWVESALRFPGTIVGSDAMRLASLTDRQHPRGMGTFSRLLGRYVRERKILDLRDALARITYLPAKRLERFTPGMKRKGRLQVGADADITIFDPATVIDRATFAEPNQYSAGIIHVVVAGQVVVRDGALRPGIFPGKAITTKEVPPRKL